MGFALGLGGGGAINAPTDIALTSTSTNDGLAIGGTIGVFSATDADVGETFTFELIADVSELFDVSGTNLISTGALTVGSHTIVARVTDSSGATYDETFVIDVASANLAPTDIILTPIVGSADAYRGSVVLDARFDGVDAAAAADEYTGKILTFAGNAQLDTAASQWGGSSLLLDGTGDYVRVEDSDDFYWPGQFTLEGWFRPDFTSGTRYLWSQGDSFSDNGSYLRYTYSSATVKFLTFALYPTGSTASILTVVTANQNIDQSIFHHFAVTRDGADLVRVFIDGVLQGSATIAGAFNSSQPFDIGNGLLNVSPWQGWLDDFRFTKGVARYTANFTPATAAFPRTTTYAVSGTAIAAAATVGTALYTITGTDPDSGESLTLTFSEQADPSNKFTVSSGQVSLSGALVAGVGYSLTIRATDVHGATYDELFTLTAVDPWLRVTQAFTEVIYDRPPTIRVSQAFTEVPYLSSTTPAKVRVTQAFTEVIYS